MTRRQAECGDAAVACLTSRFPRDPTHARNHDITNLNDFKREDVKRASDEDGDGKAGMVACPPGRGCQKTIAKHRNACMMRDHVDLITADYSPARVWTVAASEPCPAPRSFVVVVARNMRLQGISFRTG